MLTTDCDSGGGVLKSAQARYQDRNIRHHDAPERVVVDAQVAVNQAVARGDDQS